MYSSILAAQYVQERISTFLSICIVIFSVISESGKDFYIKKQHVTLGNMRKNQLSTWFYL